jgi:hypothetical protein
VILLLVWNRDLALSFRTVILLLVSVPALVPAPVPAPIPGIKRS